MLVAICSAWLAAETDAVDFLRESWNRDQTVRERAKVYPKFWTRTGDAL